jgi:hypothetical protein
VHNVTTDMATKYSVSEHVRWADLEKVLVAPGSHGMRSFWLRFL